MAEAKSLGVPLPSYLKLSKTDCPKDEMEVNAMKGILMHTVLKASQQWWTIKHCAHVPCDWNNFDNVIF